MLRRKKRLKNCAPFASQVMNGTALLANSLHTDDSYVFTKAIGEVKAALQALPGEAPRRLPPCLGHTHAIDGLLFVPPKRTRRDPAALLRPCPGTELAPPALPDPPKPPEDDEAYWSLSDAERRAPLRCAPTQPRSRPARAGPLVCSPVGCVPCLDPLLGAREPSPWRSAGRSSRRWRLRPTRRSAAPSRGNTRWRVRSPRGRFRCLSIVSRDSLLMRLPR